jgi:hypothetical protein
VIFCILAVDYFIAEYRDFGGEYEARIAIFCIIAAIDRFSRIFWKVESHWGKSESRWRNWKAVEGNKKAVTESRNASKKAESRWRNWKADEEDFLGFLGNRKAVEENRILCEENWSLGEGKSQFSQNILEFLAILGSRFDTKLATMCSHGFTWLVFQFFNCL